MWLGIVMEKNWAVSVDQCQVSCRHCRFQCISLICQACFSDVMISLGFRKQWSRPAADHQTVTMTLFLVKALGSALELLLGPDIELIIASGRKNPLCITRHDPIEK